MPTRTSRSRARGKSSPAERPEEAPGSTDLAVDTGNGEEPAGPPPRDGEAVSRVAGRVEILNVELVGAHFDRVDAGVLPTEIASVPVPDFGISVEWEVSEDGSALGCLLGFASMFENVQPYTIVAQFRLTYSIEAGDELSPHDFEQFAYWNAVFNAWPYWREYVSSTIQRAQLPAFVVRVVGMPRADLAGPSQ
jgi:hypothetical protein